MNNDIHCGNFSSSEIVRLTGTKKVMETYVHEKNLERKLGRVLKTQITTKDISWGQLMELRAFTLLPTEYSLVSDKTIVHPSVKYWVGSPDAIKHEKDKIVCDIKGLQLKGFCDVVDAFENGIDAVRKKTDSGEKFYQQLVSNACITGCKYGELILYCPYESELEAIRQLAIDYDGPDPGRFKWIAYAADDELAYLPDGGFYQNINKLKFEIPPNDKISLHQRVTEAGELLIERKMPVII
jgi:hypothetical protein